MLDEVLPAVVTPSIKTKALAGGITILLSITGGYGANQAGFMPVTQNTFDKAITTERLYQKRDRLLDRVEDKTITDYQRGILSGLCLALGIAVDDCEKRKNTW